MKTNQQATTSAKVDAQKSRIDGVAAKATAQGTTLATHTTQIAAAQGSISTHTTQIATINTWAASSQGRMSHLVNATGSGVGTISGTPTAAEYNALNTAFNALVTAFNTLLTRLQNENYMN